MNNHILTTQNAIPFLHVAKNRIMVEFKMGLEP